MGVLGNCKKILSYGKINAPLPRGSASMNMRHDLLIWRADSEDCCKDKKKIDQIFSYTSFHYVTEGYGYFNGVRLGAGQFFCAEKNQHVCYYPDSEEPWSYIYFDFSGEEPGNAVFLKQLVGEAHWGDFAYLDEVRQILQLYLGYAGRKQENPAFHRAVGDMVLALHSAGAAQPPQQSTAGRHVAEIQQYIDTHFEDKLTIEELADRFFLSRPYVRNLFMRHLGLSPKQYLQQVRMKKAGELLLQTDYEIRLIASSVGYSDQLAFSKVFKQYYGCAPTQFRSKNQKRV